jgi:hypothetical protein
MTRVKLFRVSFCHLVTFHWFGERRWLACRAYSAEVASATKAGSSGAGSAAFFNTPKGLHVFIDVSAEEHTQDG